MYTLRRRGKESAEWEKPEGMPEVLHRLLISRGVSSAQEADVFCNPATQPLHDPLLFPGVPEAVSTIRQSMEAGERICVYGDYDVDGVSACTILSGALETLGARVSVRIPSRAEEGYGLNEMAVRELASQGIDLLITVDCGIADRGNTDLAMELGMRVIVTDHHRAAKERLPRCTIVSAQVGEYPCPVLCGAGVAYKLACALDRRFEEEYIDIAALATVVDIVPLIGENRTIVAKGLAKMNEEGLRPGLSALLHEAGLGKRTVTEDTLGFQIGPRLNAGGRLGSADRSYRLLSAKTPAEAEPLAKELNDENSTRRALEREVCRQAHDQLKDYDFTNRRAIVLKGKDWNSGVIGIAASRLLEEYHYPVLLFSEQDGVLKGSCRSIEGVDIFLALHACGKHLTKYGGHAAAAGLTLDADKFNAFCEDLNRYLEENITPDTYIPTYTYDLEVRVAQVDVETCRALEQLRPFGMENPAPVFLTEFVPAGVRRIGAEGNHLKMTFTDDLDERLDAVWFGHGDAADELLPGKKRLAIGSVQVNTFQNVARAQFMIDQILPEAEGVLEISESEVCVPQSFLTDILYTEMKQSAWEPIDLDQAVQLSAENLQGIVFVSAGISAARELWEALCAAEIPLRPDIVFGKWTQDERCFSCIAICPCGRIPAGVRKVIALDMDPMFFAKKVEQAGAQLYALSEGGEPPRWMDTLPDLDDLRNTYIAARHIAARPLHLKNTEMLVREIAGEADQAEHTAMAGLVALCDMGLVIVEQNPIGLRIPRGFKADPMQNRIFQNILLLRERRRLL